MPRECLICLDPIKGKKWLPKSSCDCKPDLHEACWATWVKKTGPRCVICRFDPRLLVVAVRPIQEELPGINAKPCLKVLAALVSFVIVYMMMQLCAPTPFVYPPRIWGRESRYGEL